MRGTPLPIYRLPIATATRVGMVHVITDRNKQHYVNGSKVVTAVPSGDFQILTLTDDKVYYVKTVEYEQLGQARKKR